MRSGRAQGRSLERPRMDPYGPSVPYRDDSAGRLSGLVVLMTYILESMNHERLIYLRTDTIIQGFLANV